MSNEELDGCSDRSWIRGSCTDTGGDTVVERVLVGGSIFGVGWGISGICPGADYVSFGVGTYRIFWAIGWTLLGVYARAFWRSVRARQESPDEVAAD